MTLRIPLGSLREMSESFLPDVCTIQRGTETVTGDGTGVAWSNLATGVPCRVSRLGHRGTEALSAADAIQAVGHRLIRMPFDTDVTPKDRVVVGGRTYEVNDVTHKSYDTDLLVICAEVT